MPNRSFTAGTQFRYGFNGKENDNDVKGTGNQQDYGMRIYDTRIGRFLSVDDLAKEFPWFTPYQFAGNTPIQAIDLDGLEPEFIIDKSGKLTKPMISLFNSAFNYDVTKMQKTTWKVKSSSRFNAQTIYHTIWMGSKSLQGSKNNEDWVDYWLNLSVHEHKHRDEYRGFVSWLGWSISYGFQFALNGFAYPKNKSTEQRAYGMELPMVELMNFQGGLALKTLESNYDDETKVVVMQYIGASYKLNKLQEQFSKFIGSERKKRKLEHQIASQTKKVEDLKQKFEPIIVELDNKPSRKVQLKTEPTPERKN